MNHLVKSIKSIYRHYRLVAGCFSIHAYNLVKCSDVEKEAIVCVK